MDKAISDHFIRMSICPPEPKKADGKWQMRFSRHWHLLAVFNLLLWLMNTTVLKQQWHHFKSRAELPGCVYHGRAERHHCLCCVTECESYHNFRTFQSDSNLAFQGFDSIQYSVISESSSKESYYSSRKKAGRCIIYVLDVHERAKAYTHI